MREQQTVAQAGEAATIAAIRQAAPSSLNGDDAAVLDMHGSNSKHVCSTDILVQNRHFSFDYSTAWEVGVKAVTQNFADIQAMGARPTAILLAIATPGDMPLKTVADIARGIHEGAAPWAAELVGGDVVLSKDLVISITAMGELAGPAPALTLDGAGAGQRLIASGHIGYSTAGLAILTHFGSRASVPHNDEILNELVQWHCAPRLTPGRGSVARATGASAMTDNSDGLIRDLNTLASCSGVCIDLDSQEIAPDYKLRYAAKITGNDPWNWVLTGGEDHTLLGTTDARLPAGYRRIGAVRSQPETEDQPLVLVDGQAPAYTAGWESL
ncbi:MAG TPA: thiamine-phosphate kinase [Candidatus Corynebacterium gallistercoris]|uniref:Thiamine-monophosphate kinase n=1 Tax=Candidatus Corynebacterium gallistercoris TaxID=2838530 RepID=A0A9D1UR40_9CORY|nr:thiamine-phosphate kinase [Candidatus Corynebacterium gallistercoris]